jgi:hypothetical protein
VDLDGRDGLGAAVYDATLIEILFPQADVAELADALDLGSSEGNFVGVQVSPSAPRL